MKQQLAYLYLTVQDFITPLKESFSSIEGLEYLFYRFGWKVELEEEIYQKINQGLAFKKPLEDFEKAAGIVIEKLKTKKLPTSELKNIVKSGKELVQLISKFEVKELASFEGPLKQVEFWESIADHLLDDLVVIYIQTYQPKAFALFQLFGVIRFQQLNPQGDHRVKYTRVTMNWEQMIDMVSDPKGTLEHTYKWNNKSEKFDHFLFLENSRKALESLKVTSNLSIPSKEILENPNFNPSPDYITNESVLELSIPFVYAFHEENASFVELGLSIIPIPSPNNNTPNGFLIRPISRGQLSQEITLSDDFVFDWKVAVDASNLLLLKLFPDEAVLDSGDLKLGASFGLKSTFSLPKYIFGKTDTTRMELKGMEMGFELLGPPDDLEVKLHFNVEDLNTVIIFDSADGFLKDTVAKKPIEAGFSPEIIWSNKTGLTFNGNFKFESKINLNKELLGIRLIDLNIALAEGNKSNGKKSASLKLGIGMSGKLGPIDFVIDNMGFDLNLFQLSRTELNNESTNEPTLALGTLGLDLDYMPPRGLGLNVNSPAISGGGFLEFDYENHRYAGILALRFWKIELVAIGLITTRLPNNQKGFSMLISISVQFQPAIQLSFGFTLNGVGGIIGINRTMNVEALREKILNGAIESFMFPKDVIKNAAKIISDLREVFPPQKGHYIIAPFLRIGYSTPTIVEVDLGVLIEVPFKGRLILLGSIGVYLPNKDVKKLVEIHVDIIGDFNFAESYVTIEGRLRDSHVVGIKLSGGFAFVMDWGNNPQFLFSIGGYHPRYKKPARFPDIPRLTAQLKKGSLLTLMVQYYQAITSNSFQIGFSAEAIIKKGKARAYGFFGFDALIYFDPFYFETEINISVSVSYRGRSFLGVNLHFLLSGPEPWRAQGYAKIKIWFFSLKIRFNISWGGEQKDLRTIVQPLTLMDQLVAQMSEPGSWSGQLPARSIQVESLRTLEETEQKGKVLMHPSGRLELRQRLIPLNRTIEKLGSKYVDLNPSYEIQSYQIGDKIFKDIGRNRMLKDPFSRGGFEELTDDEKISTKDFESMHSGLKISDSDAFDISSIITSTPNDFEEILLEEDESGTKTRTVLPTVENWQIDRNISYNNSTFSQEGNGNTFGAVDELPEALSDRLSDRK